jgi:hypothetical protein
MGDEKKSNESEHINLKVLGQDNAVVQFKIKKHTPLRKLMGAYCERAVSVYTVLVFFTYIYFINLIVRHYLFLLWMTSHIRISRNDSCFVYFFVDLFFLSYTSP